MQSLQLLQLKWVEFLPFSSLRTATEDVLMEPHRMVFVHEGVRALNEVGLEVVLKKKQKQEKMGKTGETGVDFNSGWCC